MTLLVCFGALYYEINSLRIVHNCTTGYLESIPSKTVCKLVRLKYSGIVTYIGRLLTGLFILLLLLFIKSLIIYMYSVSIH